MIGYRSKEVIEFLILMKAKESYVVISCRKSSYVCTSNCTSTNCDQIRLLPFLTFNNSEIIHQNEPQPLLPVVMSVRNRLSIVSH